MHGDVDYEEVVRKLATVVIWAGLLIYLGIVAQVANWF